MNQLQTSWNEITDKILGWLDSLILLLPNLALAILFMIIMIVFARIARKFSLRAVNKISKNKAINGLLATFVSLIIAGIGIFISLSILNLDKAVTSLLAGAGVLGLAIGLAFQEPIINTISGVVLSIKRLFKIGDTIKTNGHMGIIEKITLRDIHMQTFTGELVIIPNKLVVQNPLINYTIKYGRRVDVKCGVSYNDDLEEAREIAINAVKENVNHMEEKKVLVDFDEFGDSSINFTVRFWLSVSQQSNYNKEKSKAIIAIKNAFDKHEIDIPFPIRTLSLAKDSVSILKSEFQPQK